MIQSAFVIGVCERELQYERNYGIDHRSEWCVKIRGGYYLQFVSFRKALWTFLFLHWRKEQ